MKQLLTYTSTLLRTALLLGVLALLNIPTQAQTAAQWAELPDAFETMDPATIIGDGQYYYVQFYPSDHSTCSYLTDRGVNKMVAAKDFLPNANNRLWTLEAAGDGDNTHFRLKNKDNHYLCFGRFENKARVGCVDNVAAASILTYYSLGDGYDISTAASPNYPMYRNGSTVDGIHVGQEWATEFPYNSTRRNSYANSTRMRFAKLKSNSAFIIYYRGEGANNSDPNATTTRHYLTYSGTGNAVSAAGTLRTSDVSSRTSVYRSDEPLSKLPTLATYHEDGLWTLEPSPYSDEAFYIKKYGTNDYLLNSTDGNNIGVLGAKDAVNASYRVEDASVNRYTPLVKVNYTETALTKDMFHTWDGDGSGATVTNNSPAVDFNVGNGAQIGQNAMVAGTSTVDHLIYADLSEYSKMVINGTQDMQLRVLMSRQESNSGPWVEKDVTIGSDGKAIVDLTNLALTNGAFATQTGTGTVKMTYVDYNNPDASYGEIAMGNTAMSGCNKISGGQVGLYNSSWGVNYVTYLQVDASAIPGEITKVTLKADVSGSMDNIRNTCWGVGYNSSNWSSDMTWNIADRTITTLGETVCTSATSNWAATFENKEFDITAALTNDADKKVTILVYETQGGGGYIKNPTVEVEYTPSNSGVDINFAHLNAIKTGNGGPTNGTISSITLLKETGNRYLHYSKGDGWQVEHWTGKHTEPYELWDAAFLPVEVPEPKEDNFYQVLLKVKKADPTKIKLTGATNNPTITPLSGSTLDNLYGATFTPTADLTNVFKIENMPTGCYEKIVIKFGSAVPDKWHIHTYGGQFDGLVNLSGRTEYEIDLTGEPINDFTIFNWGTMEPITITECYFTPASPSCDLVEMLNYEGNTDAYSETPGLRKTWHLQQVDDYGHFRLMAPNGQYFQADGKMTSDVNSAKIFTNTTLLKQFDLKWFYVNAAKETYVDYMITHRQSYLKKYATQYANLDLDKQGLATEVQSDWWDYDLKTQKVNHFEITHYVKRGETIKAEFPTILNNSSDHIYYQRWYHFAEKDDINTSYTDGTDIEGFKTHVTLDTPENQEVQYYVYKNGIVTGDKLYWGDESGLQHHANRNFYFTNHDGKSFTVAADVSRYSDFTYANESSKLEGDLEEPSLTMRYVYYMNDAKAMAKKLTAKTFKGFDFVDSKEGLNFLEAKTFHFPARQIFYENQKKAGYRGEFIGLRHLFSDYWVFRDGNASSTDDNNLLSAVNSDNHSGKIEVKIHDPNQTGIRLGGYNPNMTLADRNGFTDGADTDYQGFYFYDMMDLSENSNTHALYENKMSYGDSRFVVFRYPTPENGVSMVKKTGPNNPVYINVYFKVDDNTRYQLAQYTIIFDEGTVTLPYTAVNGSVYVKDDASNTNQQFKDRDPKNLVNKAGKPIAKITFDYPSGDTYHFPDKGETRHDQHVYSANSTIANSSPLPLTFDNTNYAFDGDGCNWGSYAMVSEMNTANGNKILAVPANAITYGYGPTDSEIANNPQLKSLRPDDGLQNGFLYIDASEQPGDICSAPFAGDFCANDRLMFSGWISGSNKAGADYNRCPGGVTLTVKGERNKHDENGRIVYDENGIPEKETMTLYRFCPGQIYELNNGTGNDGSTNATRVVWQQFYFEFIVTDKYDRHWIEVNNNCVSSRGGDFMLDNVEVYAVVPEVIPGVNTPLCISVDENGNTVTDMRLLKLSVDYNKLKTAGNVNENSTGSSELGFVFLDKKVFLETFKTGLQALTDAEKEILHLSTFDFNTISLEELSDAIEDGELIEIKEVEEVQVVQEGQPGYNAYLEYLAHYKAFEVAYHNAFDAAILGNKTTWHSNLPISATNPMNSSILYFEWKHRFTDMESFSFAKAVTRTHPVYGETTADGEKFVVMNGNYPELSWKTNTDYYIVTTNQSFESGRPFVVFNLCSECNNASEFRIEPPYNILGLEKSEETNDYVVCEGQIPTLLTDLKGFDFNGNEVDMKDLNFDWWLGDPANGMFATLENYHSQNKGGIRLDNTLSTLRIYYPDATDLDGITKEIQKNPHPALTLEMVDYLRDLVNAGQLVLHQKSISIPAVPAGAEDPYFYLVACPIHDEKFDQALNPAENEYVAYFCDEPQGLRVKVGEKAPTLKTGFVPNENGFTQYNYPTTEDPVLSIRLAKKAQFETVKHGTTADIPVAHESAPSDEHFLWLPIRDAKTQTASGVIRKSEDYNIYLASTNDPTWDKNIYSSMKQGSLPIVGKIVELYAKNTKGADETETASLIAAQNGVNRLCVYFTENFEVREGYNYTLSLPFEEDEEANTCDGTMLLNLKIVPDYEVWTGGADITDWNNDENWRRADGNLGTSTDEPEKQGAKRNNNELLVSSTLPEESGLYQYKTNYWNYRTAKDRILRKGFAPLYCTHILMKRNEWGDAPVLYDALAGKDDLDAYPFPNLTDSYTTNTVDYIDQKYETIEAIGTNSFAIFNEADSRLIYGTNNQNLGYNVYDRAVQSTNSGYYFKLESAAGHYLLHLQKPEGGDYVFDAWGGTNHPGYLNSQPVSGTVSFVLGLAGRYGQDGENLALWDLETDADHPGKFALKNVGTGGYLKNNANAKYNAPTYFTFCTLKKENGSSTTTKYNILKFDMQARIYDIWSDTYGSNPDKGRTGDLIAEMYQINSCDEIAFQPGTELLNAHLLNYNNAWVEYELDNKRWYLLGSPLQGTISGEWYAPTGTAQQKTTYYENVTFGEGYDRYSPAIYQRSWDKAKAVLYEVGSEFSTSDNPDDLALDENDVMPGSADQGAWSGTTWNTSGADEYLDRLGYKPLGGKKANVAIKGVWSNTYNDATVDYTKGGFSVMVMNHLKGNDQSNDKALIRLPKEDTMYDYYRFSEDGSDDGGTDTYLSDPANQDQDDVQTNLNRAKNRGRLKSDMLLPASNSSLPTYQQIQRTETAASRYGDRRTYTRVPTQKSVSGQSALGLPLTLRPVQETVSPGISGLGYYLVENPFVTGLDMNEFFAVNTGLEKKYWILTPGGQQLVQQAPDGNWIKQENGTFTTATNTKLAPGQGFFVQATTPDEATTVSFTSGMQTKTRYGVKSGEEPFTIVVGTEQVMTTKTETITLDDGTTQTVTYEVPEVDGSGNYVIREITEDITISTYVQATGEGNQFPLRARTSSDETTRGNDNDVDDESLGLVITARRDADESSALVMLRENANDNFLPTEDAETFINSDLKQVPTVYTLCGRLATTINSIHDFRYLPLGVESASDAPCVLTFNGVELLGDSIAFYDAVKQELTPLKSGMQFTVSGQTQNRYYLVKTLIQEEAAVETHLQIFTRGDEVTVIASTEEPLTSVRCYDTAGRLVYSASPKTAEHRFNIAAKGIFIIEAQTKNDRKTKKVSVSQSVL